eukprot:Nitzschia sp. Nitz4//scaffold67_size101165//49307//51220//NITZ4_004528-RA/size101165-processed-gene-0.39-mRNA-1//1//CDS//3329556471//6264//frame0
MEEPVRVAVLGGGAAGMFFCHAVEKLRKQGAPIPLAVTCFEKASTPGGIWKSEEASTADARLFDLAADNVPLSAKAGSTRIYDELWTNGPSHNLEFYDYTFDEHFKGQPVPVYLPRKDVAEYLFARITKHAPNLVKDYFKFGTEVSNVVYDKESETFDLTLTDVATGEICNRTFDKCIWACGQNGRGHMPLSLQKIFGPLAGKRVNGYKRELVFLHSTQTEQMQKNVPGRRILLIGGGYSAEDLTLQCIKWGAEHVDVAVRAPAADNPISWNTRWPYDKATVHCEVEVKDVEENMDTKLYNVRLQRVKWMWPNGYAPCDNEEEEEESDEEEDNEDASSESEMDDIILKNIDVVICCTGYCPNLSMLDKALQEVGGIPDFLANDEENRNFSVPADWKMDTNHPAHKFVGDVPAGLGRLKMGCFSEPNTHRGISINNPNMIFLSEHGFDVPLMALDVHAWLLATYLTGQAPMPTSEQLREQHYKELILKMDIPFLRFHMDEGYAKKMLELGDEGGFWYNPEDEDGDEDCGWDECESHYEEFSLRLLAKVMIEGRYPGLYPGTFEELNEVGKKMIDFDTVSYDHRADREEDEDEERWMTFRDGDVSEGEICSLYTGTKARNLKVRWLDAVGPVSIQNGDV